MNSIKQIARRLGLQHNVSIRVIDEVTGQLVSEHVGHNASTNSLLTGIAHYLTGDGVLSQGDILGYWVPRYISLGTMGLMNQEEDADGLPLGIGSTSYDGETVGSISDSERIILGKVSVDTSSYGAYLPGVSPSDLLTEDEKMSLRFADYMNGTPGYGADGYDSNCNNGRTTLGLGKPFDNRPNSEHTIDCELITDAIKRSPITFREIVPESQAEYPETIDVIFSAFLSTGQLSQFREKGKDYVFISEVGLWSRPDYVEGGDNGLLAGYRLCPPDQENWAVTASSVTYSQAESLLSTQYPTSVMNKWSSEERNRHIKQAQESIASSNRQLLRESIIKIGPNQVAQIIWKIQIGGVAQLGGLEALYPSEIATRYRWTIV